jgi:hypothetical protein
MKWGWLYICFISISFAIATIQNAMMTTMLRKRKTKKWDAIPIMTDPVCIRSCEKNIPRMI